MQAAPVQQQQHQQYMAFTNGSRPAAPPTPAQSWEALVMVQARKQHSEL